MRDPKAENRPTYVSFSCVIFPASFFLHFFPAIQSPTFFPVARSRSQPQFTHSGRHSGYRASLLSESGCEGAEEDFCPLPAERFRCDDSKSGGQIQNRTKILSGSEFRPGPNRIRC